MTSLPSSAASASKRVASRRNLPHAAGVRGERALDAPGRRPLARRARAAAPASPPSRAPRAASSSRPLPSRPQSSRPGGAVAVAALGPQLRAERDQLGQVGDRLALATLRDADEPVRVEVVAEQQRRRRPRPARRGASSRSGRGSPRRSSRGRARSARSPSGEKTGSRSRSPCGRSASAQSGLSRAPPRGDRVPEVSGRRRSRQRRSPSGRSSASRVGERDEHGLELRRRDVDAARRAGAGRARA